MQTINIKITSYYVICCLIWGSTWLAIRLGLDSITPFVSAGYRFVIASLFILLLMKIKKLKLQTDAVSMKLYIVLAVFSFYIPFGLVYWGELYVPTALASVLFAVYPFFIALFSKFALPNEKIGFWKIAGMIASFVGIIIIFYDEINFDFSYGLLGMAGILLSAILQAGMSVATKKYGMHINTISLYYLPMLIGGVLLLITGFIFEEISTHVYDFKAVSSILYLAIFGSLVAFTLYFWLLKNINIVIVALITFITPVIAILLGYIILNESLSQTVLSGTVLVLSGLLISNMEYYKLKRKKS